ncbi:MAG: glycosyltransferase family 39 protein [Candidatus Aceula meridiana]|nr:glycosyltransferase family 39 protein [Candidatus Aceula meridiana]
MAKKQLIFLTIILLIAMYFQIHDLDQESFRSDEGFSVMTSHLSLSKIIQKTSLDVHPPLYYFILHYWMEWLGDSEYSTRLLSVVFGFLLIFMVYRLGCLIFDKDVGLLGAFFVALSKFHIKYSQDARGYSLLAFLAVASMHSFIKLFKKENRNIDYLGYIFFSTLLIYTHIYGLFIIIAQNIYFIVLCYFSKWKRNFCFKKWIFLQTTLFILFLPWVRVFIGQVFRIQGHYWIRDPSILTTFRFLIIILGSRSLLFLFSVLILFALVRLRNKDELFFKKSFSESSNPCHSNNKLTFFEKNFFLLMWILTPMVLPFIISKISTPIYHHRYLMAASPAFFLLAARGMVNIRKYSKYVGLSLLFIIISFSLLEINEYYDKVKKHQWREAAYYIESKAKTQDLLLFNAGFCRETAFAYYSRRADITRRSFPPKAIFANEGNIRNLDPIIEPYDRVWFILAHNHDPKKLILKKLSKEYCLVDYKEYFLIKIFLFEKINPKARE